MGQFSDDGQWWWDGTTWVATAQVVLPQLPMTEFERSGKLEIARGRRKNSERLYWANTFPPLAWLTGSAFLVVAPRAASGRIPGARIVDPTWLVRGSCYTGSYTVATPATSTVSFDRRFEFEIGSGTGIRTLNLAVNRSLRPVQKYQFEFATCR
jgi:hypothetical protein